MKEFDRINKEKLRWACRRGMLELDLFLVPFFEHAYDTLSKDDQAHFTEMLHHTDPELLAWLMGHASPQDENIQKIVATIRAFKRENTFKEL